MEFHAGNTITGLIKRILSKSTIEARFIPLTDWNQTRQSASELKDDQGLVVFMARRGMVSYEPYMAELPDFINRNLQQNNYLLVYPFSELNEQQTEKRAISNHDDFAAIGTVIGKLFK